MRLFVAITPPPEVLERLAKLVAAARRDLPRARWVGGECLHLTLLFLGETPAAAVSGLRRALMRAVEGHSAFDLRLDRPGVFPVRGPARVAWVGVEPSPALAALRLDVVAELDHLAPGQAERPPFHPHLTVARCRPPWGRRAADRWTEALAGKLGIPFTVDSIELVESRLGAGGARYRDVETFPLEVAP